MAEVVGVVALGIATSAGTAGCAAAGSVVQGQVVLQATRLPLQRVESVTVARKISG